VCPNSDTAADASTSYGIDYREMTDPAIMPNPTKIGPRQEAVTVYLRIVSYYKIDHIDPCPGLDDHAIPKHQTATKYFHPWLDYYILPHNEIIHVNHREIRSTIDNSGDLEPPSVGPIHLQLIRSPSLAQRLRF
jgi:hypothetical protein